MAKTVLITGASRGIGAAMARLFAKNNYNVIVNYNRNFKLADKIVSEIKKEYQIEAIALKADISKEEEVNKMLEIAYKTFKNIDVLINNAATYNDEDIFEKSSDNFKKVIDVNIGGTFIVSKLVAKKMLEIKDGCIINISSTNGIDTYNSYSADYDASKAAIISLTHNFAQALSPYVRVNAIAPGWVSTESVLEMDPQIIKEEQEKIFLKRFASPDEIAQVALFLASDAASYVNNSVIRVDGGIK